MGLLDKAKEEASNYITAKDFICFLSYKINEPIENIASWLLYNRFDSGVNEFEIDRHYRVDELESNNCNLTYQFLEQITRNGFYDFIEFIQLYEDDGFKDDSHLGFYEPMDIYFYYSIDQLNTLSFLNELNLDFKESSELDYTVYSNDLVTAEKSNGSFRSFKYITIQEENNDEQEQQIIKEYGENSQAHIFFKRICITKESKLETEKEEAKQETISIRDKELNTRSRNTALKIMYALLIKSGLENISPTSNSVRRNANTEIELLLEELGIPVKSETIGKYLSDIKILEEEYPYKKN